MSLKETPVLLLTGYLGSGKTTLLNRILGNRRGIRFAVIVNDIGEVNIDESLIRKGGIVGGKDNADLVALQNGCICCTLQMDLVGQLTSLVSSGNFDYIVIEASGICEPEPIAQTIYSIPRMDPKYVAMGIPRLDCIVTVVDALRMKDEFGCGNALAKQNLDEEDIENLIIQQIEFCNIVLLNKISEVTPEEAAQIKTVVRAIQPQAKIIECDYADIDFDEILNTGLFNFNEVACSATWIREIERPATEEEEKEARAEHEHEEGHHHHHHHHKDGEAEEYGIRTMVYYRRKPIDLNKFDYFVSRQWPVGIIRSKGIIYFSNNTDMSYLFESAGRQKRLTEAGLWYATVPEQELEKLMQTEPGLMRDWDPVYGDRMIKLVIIGRDIDKDAITALLDATLAK